VLNLMDANEGALVKGASLFFGPSFIEVHAETGGHTSMLDRAAFHAYLPPDASTLEIARLVQQALDASYHWDMELFAARGGWRGMTPRWNDWVQEMHQRFPAKKSKSALFKGLRWLLIKRRENVLTLFPKNRVRGDGYGFLPGENKQTLSLVFHLDDPAFDWSDALRQGMAHCKG